MPHLDNEIERGMALVRIPLENIASVTEDAWVRAECLRKDRTFNHHGPSSRTSVLTHARLGGD